jgi:hypothetical protein
MKRIDDDPRDTLDKKMRRMGKEGFEQPAKDRSENRTALDPPCVSPEKIYRIAVIGFWQEARTLSGVLDRAYGDIFKDHQGPRIALHSGYVIRREPWPAGTDEVCAAAENHEVAALFETALQPDDRAYLAYQPRKGLLPLRLYQRFKDSTDANADPAIVAELVEDCGPNRQRTINLAGLPLGLLICGENNVLTNDQGDGNRAFVRHHPDAKLFEGVGVVFNGAHTTMGNWGKINRRLGFLSDGDRWAFYATNCVNESWGSSTVRGYYNGALVADSSMRTVAPPPDVTVRRFNDDESTDRYLALAFDIPGRLLVRPRRSALA